MALKWEQMTEEEREEYADQDKVKWRNNVKLGGLYENRL